MYDLIPLVPRDKGHVDIKEAINQYKDDPPSQLLVDKEYSRWMSADKYERPTLVAQTITLCNKNVYPNIWILLGILGTEVVTSWEFERS